MASLELEEFEFDIDIGHDEMTLDGYQDRASDFAIYHGALLYPALGLAGEAGEVAEKVKKLWRDDEIVWTADDLIEQLPHEKAKAIAHELGDVMWYVANIANDIGYSLEEIADMNITKLSDRYERGAIKGSGDNR